MEELGQGVNLQSHSGELALTTREDIIGRDDRSNVPPVIGQVEYHSEKGG